jgi:phytoene dehydrogenase-like protein
MAEVWDVVVIGSGHNGLVAAAYLARSGLSVQVIERNPVAGGAVASEELTEPGFIHDTFSSWHPLFKLSAAYAELGRELEARGLRYCETPIETTANVLADGSATVAYRDAAMTVEGFDPRDRPSYLAEMESFGATIETVGQLLGTELYSADAARLAWRLGRSLGRRGGLTFVSDALSSARAWFETRFQGREVADLYAPWSLHTGISPDGAAVRRDQPLERAHEAGRAAADDRQADGVQRAGDREHLEARPGGIRRQAHVQRPWRVEVGDLGALEARLEPGPRRRHDVGGE